MRNNILPNSNDSLRTCPTLMTLWELSATMTCVLCYFCWQMVWRGQVWYRGWEVHRMGFT